MPALRYGVFTAGSNLLAVLITLLVIISSGTYLRAQPVTIAALGDSLVHGYGLPTEKGFVPQLQKWLNTTEADITIVNAGVSGDTSAGGVARIDWTLTPDVQALVLELGANDVLRGLDPEVTRKNLKTIIQTAQTKGLPVLLIGIAAPSNYGSDYKTSFDSIFTSLAAEQDIPLYPNFFAPLTDLPDRANTLATYMQADAIHPNEQGIALIVQEIGPFVLELAQMAKTTK